MVTTLPIFDCQFRTLPNTDCQFQFRPLRFSVPFSALVSNGSLVRRQSAIGNWRSVMGNQRSEIGNTPNRQCLYFPGQGSQYPGMGKDLAENFPAARKVFEEVDEALEFSSLDCASRDRRKTLQLTENTQPAILTVSVAALRAMEAEGFPARSLCRTQPRRVFSSRRCRRTEPGRCREDRPSAWPLHAGSRTPGAGAMAAVIGGELERN